MSISRRSLIAGVAAGGALMAINAPAANARSRFVAAAKDPVVKKVATPLLVTQSSEATAPRRFPQLTPSPFPRGTML